MPKSTKRVPRPVPLPKLMQFDRNAATVYMALRWLASGQQRVATTRRAIRSVCGLCPQRIGQAVAALAKAHWIRLSWGRLGTTARWYRVTFTSPPTFATAQKMMRSKARRSGPEHSDWDFVVPYLADIRKAAEALFRKFPIPGVQDPDDIASAIAIKLIEYARARGAGAMTKAVVYGKIRYTCMDLRRRNHRLGFSSRCATDSGRPLPAVYGIDDILRDHGGGYK